jgi:hypothetical protein
MTDEQLEAIRERAEIASAHEDVPTLFAEVEQLLALVNEWRERALWYRPLVLALAEYPWQSMHAADFSRVLVPCPWCHMPWSIVTDKHFEDCPVTKARSLLRSEG